MSLYDYADCFSLTTTTIDALATLLEAFFNIFLRTHTHRHEGIALPLLRMYARGKKFSGGIGTRQYTLHNKQ